MIIFYLLLVGGKNITIGGKRVIGAFSVGLLMFAFYVLSFYNTAV